MKESKLKLTRTIWVVLSVVLAVQCAWASRTGRKESAPAASRPAPSSQSPRFASPARTSPSPVPRTGSFHSMQSIPRTSTPSIDRSASVMGSSGTLGSRSQGLFQSGRAPAASTPASSAAGRTSRKVGPEYGTRPSLVNPRESGGLSPGEGGRKTDDRRASAALDARRDRKAGPGLPPGEGPVLSQGRISRKAGGHFEYPYRDRSFYYYDRHYYPSRPIFSWISWPDCCRPIYYDYGPECTFGFFWPYYHRKFVFISLGGYWPCYTYRRYYWYGWHPYEWYGPCPPEYVKLGDTYNYYYYNAPPKKSPDANAVDQAGEKLQESPPAGPQEKTQADAYFEEGVKAFEAGSYAAAAAKFGAAMELAPDDIVLPFAYVQAVFAQGEHKKAADALREVLAKTSPEREGVFYPRGLYPAEDALQVQVKRLGEKAASNPLDADLQLLLGYQLLGMGKLDEAAKPLTNARLDYNNHQAATRLLSLLEKLKKADEKKAGLNNQETTPTNGGADAPDASD